MENRPADSIVSAQERSTKIREEAERLEREQADAVEKQRAHQAAMEAVARAQEVRNIEVVSTGETREHLLQRIRSMRQEASAVEPEPLGYRTEDQIKQLEAEQAAGRAAVAKAEEMQALYRERWQKEEAEQKAKEGTMESVYHPNPSMDQVYPTNRRR
jgi:hypothetical protein